MSPWLIRLMAVGCALTVANLYYAQPLLGVIGAALGEDKGRMATMITFTQLGYAAGLVLIVPLGDLVENRRLIVGMLLATVVALLSLAFAPSLAWLLGLSFVLGLCCVIPQLLVPLAAHLAPEASRGRVVGQVMSGLLMGILLARAASGLVSDRVGWRGVYLGSAGLMLLLALILRLALPVRRPGPGPGYRSLLGSLVSIWKAEPVLRWRAFYQFLMFGTFSLFWTSVTFQLQSRGWGVDDIGLFALVGAVGALVAPVAGHLGDRGHGRAATGGALLLATTGFLVTLGGSVVLLAVGAVVLDAAVQVTLVLGQQAIYGLRPEQRSRLSTLYIATFFVGGACASSVAGVLYSAYGWPGVVALGALLPTVGLMAWFVEGFGRGPGKPRG